MGGSCQLRAACVARRRRAFSHHLESAHLRADGGHPRSADDFATGVTGWRAELDYRYCWLRDATLTLCALMAAGYRDEAAAWRDWLLRAAAGDPSRLQIMYGVAGEKNLKEEVLDWLPGYEGSSPVRIGNAASDQYQLDVYGEVLGALHEARRTGLEPAGPAWDSSSRSWTSSRQAGPA